MVDQRTEPKPHNPLKGFKAFAGARIIVFVIVALVFLWVVYLLLGWMASHTDTVKHVGVSSGHDGASGHAITATSNIKGVTFVDALIRPMHHELEERSLGWRPNDILIGKITDNIRYYQRGTLEVTRRGVVALMERIARTGSTAAINENVEDAMNDFSNSPTNLWLPSAESKYKDAIKALKAYKGQLKRKEVTIYTRPDNLIPLLSAFEDILGSCDDNLVKTHEDDGEEVSFFKADDYFFYAMGAAHTMRTILEAVYVDFHETLQTRRGTELLHHAILSLEHAGHLEPLIILEGDPDGFLANHRANLAAHISHARFYLGQLIKALST
ncbi:MAG: hypothetical protein CSA22_02440 [Deltaproteobacteria bacterium]|nr:MAG: hypothetical protein CSA22_02440 [Deltaproteobacteria bacterium]